MENLSNKIILLVTIAIYIILSVIFWNYFIDDAFISFRYAKNFVDGNGLVYNVGERVEGYTNFLWIIILGVFIKFGISPLIASKIIGLCFGTASIILTYALGRLIFKQKGLINNLAPFLLAINAAFITTSIEGLETPLFTFLFLLTVYVFIKAKRNNPFQWLVFASFSSVFLCLTRPDGVLLWFILLLVLIWQYFKKEVSLKMILAYIFPMILVYGLYFIWRYQYYGLLFPNTFYAKSGGNLELLFRGLKYILNVLNELGGPVFIGLCLITIFNYFNFEVIVIILAVSGRLVFHLWSGGPWVSPFRFIVPVTPMILILFQQSIVFFKENIKFKKILLACVILVFLAHNLKLIAKSDYIKGIGDLRNAHIVLGKWLKENTPVDIKIALDDAGAIAYYSERHCIDMLGLNDRHISGIKGKYMEKTDINYIFSRKPDYIILLGKTEIPEPGRFILPHGEQMYKHNYFKDNYGYLKSFKFSENYYLYVFKKN